MQFKVFGRGVGSGGASDKSRFARKYGMNHITYNRQRRQLQTFGSGPKQYWDLQNNDKEIYNLKETSSSALRRKGRLKEQDKLIEKLVDMHDTHTCREVMEKLEVWVNEHRKNPRSSTLKRLVPSIGNFFTSLKLVEAFEQYDESFGLSKRKYVKPNFAELRHILNMAQVKSSIGDFKLITFDADGTLYPDGHRIESDNAMIDIIIQLMKNDVYVSIITAAGYPGEAYKYEQRVQGLVDEIRNSGLRKDAAERFFIMGGECNYLLQYNYEQRCLAELPPSEWQKPQMLLWKEEDIQYFLDQAEDVLRKGAKSLDMPIKVIRKERAVGVIPTCSNVVYEVLEDLVLRAQDELEEHARVPFCAFNGGNDVFVDIGNKLLGLGSLMDYLNVQPHQAIHVGDRFTISGNDMATRDCSPILWVANPTETSYFVGRLLQGIKRMNDSTYLYQAGQEQPVLIQHQHRLVQNKIQSQFENCKK